MARASAVIIASAALVVMLACTVAAEPAHPTRELTQFLPFGGLFAPWLFGGFNQGFGGGAAASSAASPGSVTSSVAAGRRLAEIDEHITRQLAQFGGLGGILPFLLFNNGWGGNVGGGAAASSAASPGAVSSSVAVPGAAAGSSAGGGATTSNVAVSGRKMLL